MQTNVSHGESRLSSIPASAATAEGMLGMHTSPKITGQEKGTLHIPIRYTQQTSSGTSMDISWQSTVMPPTEGAMRPAT